MQAVANQLVQKGLIPLPDRIVICKWGESKDLSGAPVIVNDTTLAQLAANQEKYGHLEIALDFEHTTVPTKDKDGNIIKAREPQPIAAMGTLSVERDRGIVFHPLSWTPDGEHYYTGRHYRDISPTVKRNEKGEVVFVQSVALTRAGQIQDLHAFSAALAAADLTTLSTPIPTIMENTTTDKPDYKALLLKKLELSDEATDEEIIAALSAPEKMEEEETTPMSVATTPDNITALSARLDKIERDTLLAAAVRDGKVIPLSAEAQETVALSVLKDIIDNSPAGAVPLKSGGIANEPDKITPLSADEKIVAERMGLTEEQFRAAKD